MEMCYQKSLFCSLPFSLSTNVEGEISQVKLRQTFPFLLTDEIVGRAAKSVSKQTQPKLLNSYQGHIKSSIVGLIYSEKNQILISSSGKSARLWNLKGQVKA
jgi:WD40 repeat protein